MRIAFRVDASHAIGSGHVIRCLTLAQVLARDGHACLFVSRRHPGHLIDTVERAGFPVAVIGGHDETGDRNAEPEALMPDWELDAAETAEALNRNGRWDWLVVDHYGLEARWERAMGVHVSRILVVNELLGREHDCTLLLDQTLGRTAEGYLGHVNADAHLLLGTEYALLREQFRLARTQDRAPGFDARRKRLLITMGGIDRHNATGRILTSLAASDAGLPSPLAITVVMGARAPWIDEVRTVAAALDHDCRILVDVADMAGLMLRHDAAVGAAGTTSWERCCVGLPTVVWALAENQRPIARALHDAGVALYVEGAPDSERTAAGLVTAVRRLFADPATMRAMGSRAMALVDGRGAHRVARMMVEMSRWT